MVGVHGIQLGNATLDQLAIRPDTPPRHRFRIQLRIATGVRSSDGEIAYQFSYQWSIQHEVVKDFDVFFHGFYNAASLLRSLIQFQNAATSGIPNVTVLGCGGIWTINNRIAVWASYNLGVTPASPKYLALVGFAVAF